MVNKCSWKLKKNEERLPLWEDKNSKKFVQLRKYNVLGDKDKFVVQAYNKNLVYTKTKAEAIKKARAYMKKSC